MWVFWMPRIAGERLLVALISFIFLQLHPRLFEPIQGTEMEGNISKMFGGVIKNYIECVNVEFESSREEPYFGML